jgi:putative glutamine amidotransferase
MPIAATQIHAANREPSPVIGVICCLRREGDHTLHGVAEKYIIAAAEGAGGVPLLVPAVGDKVAAEEMVTRLDGLLLPGSRSNVEPHHYGGPPSLPETPHDPARDGMSLPLIRAAVAADVPVLAICRGIQELNVALGGSLHQRLAEVPGRIDHRAVKGSLELRYGYHAHAVSFAAGGYFERLAGAAGLIVNSLHHQGIDRPAPGLVIEATAPDGQIEAVRLPSARFVVGVQWHPEYRLAEEPFSCALFGAFGEACRAYARRRRAA